MVCKAEDVSRTVQVSSSWAVVALVSMTGCADLSGLSGGGSDAGHEAAVSDGGGKARDAAPEAPTAACNLSTCRGACMQGRCVETFADGNVAPLAIATDSTSVYWVTSTGVGSAPLGGGAVATLADGLDSGWGVALDDEFVYFADQQDGEQDGLVARVAKAGGAVTTLVTGQWLPVGLAVSGSSLFVCLLGDETSHPPVGSLLEVPLKGVPQADAGTTVVAGSIACGAVAVDATSVYWADLETNAVFSRPLAGGATATLSTSVGASALYASGGVLYIGTANGEVLGVSLASGSQQAIYTGDGQSQVMVVAGDESGVYWGSLVAPADGYDGPGSIRHLAPGAPSSQELLSGTGFGVALALRQPTVYFSAFDTLEMDTLVEP